MLGCAHCRRRADRLDHRRRQHRDRRARPSRRGRGSDDRRGASGPARRRSDERGGGTASTRARVVPFAEIAGEVSSSTRLVACSHVSWVSGQIVDTEALAATGVPVLLDAAQAIGAIPVDVERARLRLLCRVGSEVAVRARGQRLPVRAPGAPRRAARPVARLRLARRSAAARSSSSRRRAPRAWTTAFRPASAAPGRWRRWRCSRRPAGTWVHERAATLAAVARRHSSASAGSRCWPRGRSTLVSWKAADPEAEVARLAEDGFVVRFIPAFGVVRASVGAWTSEDELERLVEPGRRVAPAYRSP